MTSPFTRLFLATAALCLVLPASGAEPLLVRLRLFEPAPGKTMRITATTTAQGGTITVREGDKQRTGTIDITRKRVIDQRIAGTGPKRKLTLRILADEITTTTRLAGSPAKTEQNSGPLSGHTVTSMLDATKRWRLFLDDTTTDSAATAALSALEAYTNRRWFPPRPVRIGQSWQIDPAFIRHIVNRDLGKAPIEATMTLREVRKGADGSPGTAVIDCKIESRGARKENAAHPESGAVVSLTGTLEIDLATMLDEKLVLTGTLSTYATKNGITTAIRLPVRMETTKTIQTPMPSKKEDARTRHGN